MKHFFIGLALSPGANVETGVAVLDQNNEIILAKQFRPGPKKILLELPGGMIDDNETPIDYC